jgi:hypothetical protein
VRIFKTKLFAKFARRERIPDASLSEAIERAGRGLVDADLGAGVIKQRVARQGQGRSGGYRTLIACRFGDRAVFLFGFAKNDRENIDGQELAELREAAASWLAADEKLIWQAVTKGFLVEVQHER